MKIYGKSMKNAKAVADILKLPLSDATVGRYADGEVSIKVTRGGCAPRPL